MCELSVNGRCNSEQVDGIKRWREVGGKWTVGFGLDENRG